MIMRRARADEADFGCACIEDARAYHRSLGFEQWHPEYPTLETIAEDIAQGTGFVFEQDGERAGYCCILIGHEPAYDVIDGSWKTELPYAVVHRMAFRAGGRGRGFSSAAFDRIKEYCAANGIRAVRIDTQGENAVMRHIVEKNGFVYCGLVTFNGGPKLAYEWDAEA